MRPYNSRMKRFSIVSRKVGLLAFCCSPILLNGCASGMALYSDAAHRDLPGANHTIPRVYGGTVNDWNYLLGEDPDGMIMIFDLPLSVAADTVTLPYTAVRQSIYGNLYDPKPDR